MILPFNDICSVIGAKENSDTTPIKYLLTDSRDLTEAACTLFIALRTPSSDGHGYITDLYRRGVRHFIVDTVPTDMNGMDGAMFATVPDTLTALQALGAHARNMFKGVVVGITGSKGKTCVKEYIYQALLPKYKITRSPRSYNSRIGVPLSLWEIKPDDEYAVIEAGIDGDNQMRPLADMIRPHIGILTGIDDEHDDGFASCTDKLHEKARLFETADTIIYDKNIGNYLVERYPDRRLIPVEAGHPTSASQAFARALISTILPSECDTILACANFDNVSTRIDVNEGSNDCLMLFDAFTNDIRSLEYALDFMRRRSGLQRCNTVILGDMRHNDNIDTLDFYANVADLLVKHDVSRFIGIGAELNRARGVFENRFDCNFCESTDDFLSHFDISDFYSELILIKGYPVDSFREIRAKLENPRHDTIVEVNLDAMVHNFNYYRSLLNRGTGIIAMIKASGYGTGALEIARTLQAQGATYLTVAVVDEGVALRRGGITMPIIVLNPITNSYRALFKHNLEPALFTKREFDILSAEARRAGVTHYPVHIKFDTGMHRLGFLENDIDTLAAALNASEYLYASSVFSHLATADCYDEDTYTRMQLDRFESMTGRLQSLLTYTFKRHILNTAGIMRYPQYQYDMVRLGIGLYGISPVAPCSELRPVSRLLTTIISLKEWPAGTTIGYGRRGVLKRRSVIATLPIGYADGIDRHLGCGAATFRIRNTDCPTVGNICMDLCMIDVTDVQGVSLGDRVEIFGPDAPVERLANTLDTIPYEILTSVSERVRRIYYRE